MEVALIAVPVIQHEIQIFALPVFINHGKLKKKLLFYKYPDIRFFENKV